MKKKEEREKVKGFLLLGSLLATSGLLGSSLGSAFLAELFFVAETFLLEDTHPLSLLLAGLEATVTNLGGSIDELEVDLFGELAGLLGSHGAAEGHDTATGTADGTLDHDVVVADETVTDETTHGVDGLLGEVVFGGGVLGVNNGGAAEAVDLLVEVGTVVVTVLTSTSDGEGDTFGMPRADAGNLAETTMGLAGEGGNTPTVDDTFETVTAGDGADVTGFGLLEDGVDTDLLFEETFGHLDLILDGATVDLDFLDEGLLGADAVVAELAVLGVGDDTDDSGVLFEAADGVGASDDTGLGVLRAAEAGEGLLLALLPVGVEAALELGGDVVSPDGAEGAETTGSLTVAGDTDDDDRGSFEDGDGFDDFLLVDAGTGAVNITDDVGHTSLEDGEGGEVRLGGLIVLGVATNATADLTGALAGEETQVTVTGMFELRVRHLLIQLKKKIFLNFSVRKITLSI